MQALHDVPAPAKLNLFLHITGRRSDGYHLLQSVFVLIDWCDWLHFERRPHHSTITRQDLSAPLPADDLCLRAARALQQATGCSQGAHIAIDKRVPAQAGMGGGSSDAASTLLALNRLWNLRLTRVQLQTIGLSLGADVPFFLSGSTAWVEGIGDIICPFDLPQAAGLERFVVVKPEAGLDTKAIFSNPSLKRDSTHATIADFVAAPKSFTRNDLQPVAKTLCPEVSQAIDWLETKGLQGRMTGSGSAVFAAISHDVDLFDAPAAWQVKICDNLGLHPLAGWIRD
ncbi:4-(cytidine 5'-diphospho)-2-C-methyl-D-erythritol kinase [Melaminivora sp.]